MSWSRSNCRIEHAPRLGSQKTLHVYVQTQQHRHIIMNVGNWTGYKFLPAPRASSDVPTLAFNNNWLLIHSCKRLLPLLCPSPIALTLRCAERRTVTQSRACKVGKLPFPTVTVGQLFFSHLKPAAVPCVPACNTQDVAPLVLLAGRVACILLPAVVLPTATFGGKEICSVKPGGFRLEWI